MKRIIQRWKTRRQLRRRAKEIKRRGIKPSWTPLQRKLVAVAIRRTMG